MSAAPALPFAPAFIEQLTRACEDREGRPISGGREIRFCCPVHAPDTHPSARWNPERAVWRCDACGAGGGALELARALEIPLPDRRFTEPHWTTRSPGVDGSSANMVVIYPYDRDKRVVRRPEKDFRPEHLDGNGQWVRGKGPDPWPLYRQGELPADLSAIVHVVEGEKDADTLAALGWIAVSPGSSTTPWQDAWTVALAGRPIVIHADNDEPGRKRTAQIAALLAVNGQVPRTVSYPELSMGGDVTDFLADHDITELIAKIEATESTPSPAYSSPAFPVEVLPAVIRDYVERVAASQSSPVEMVAVPMLAVIGGVAGHRVQIRIKPGWDELPVLWAVTVAPPGSAKTAAQNAAVRGCKHLQRLANERYALELEEYERRLRSWKSNRSDDAGPEPQKPNLWHYWTSNATTEAIFDRHAHAHGLSLIVDEASGLLGSFDQYRSRGSKGSDRQTYLSIFSGTDVKIDRQSRPSTTISHPAVPLMGGIQDDIVPTLLGEQEGRDGFIERFLLIRPDVQPADWTDDDVPDYLGHEVDAFFERLDRLRPMDRHPTRILMSSGAKDAWRHWFNSNAQIIRAAQGIDRGFAAKWPIQCARIALILHLAWAISEDRDPMEPISRERMEDAIELAEWFRAHLYRVLPLLKIVGTGQTGGQASRVVRQLRKAEGAWVTRSALLRALGNVSTDRLTEQLAALREAGTVETRTTRAPDARKSLEEWRLVVAGDVTEATADRMVF